MIACYVLLSFILYLIVRFLYFSTKKPNNFPPGPKWYPIVGSFPQFKVLMNSTKDVAIAFDILSKRYKSNIIGLKLGSQNIVVVSSCELVKQILLDNNNYLGRPDNFFSRLRSFGTIKGITLTSGKLWHSQRNFVINRLHKLGYHKKTMEIKITTEIEDVMKIIDSDPIDIDFRKLLSFSILKILWTLVAGIQMSRKNERLEKLLELMHQRTLAFDMTGDTLNYFPWLRYFAPEKLGYNFMKRLNLQLKDFFSETIENHMSTWMEGNNDDLIYAYISEIKNNNGIESYFNYEGLQIVCLDLFFGGTILTSISLDFAFLAMATHQDVQARVQKLLDETFDRTIPLEYSDRYKVPYVVAVINEIARCYTVIPINAPRASLEKTVLNGYDIPQGTSIYMSFNSIHTNPEYFDEADIFRPERFLNSNGELISHEAFFPFGLGKRKCLGDVFAKMCQFMFFTEIIRNYNIYPLNETVIKQKAFVSGIFRSKRKYPIKLVKRL